MPAVLQIDPSWVSTGWALVASTGVIAAGRVAMCDKEREQDVFGALAFLEHRARPLLAGYLLDYPADRVRVGIELPPRVVSMKGNKTLTALQLGRLIGTIEGWAAAEAWMDPPALVEVAAWRKYHQIKASGRDEYKREAIAKARQLGLGRFLDPYPGAKAVNGGQQADVAEAMLEGLYAVRFYGAWPSRPTVQQLAVDVARVTR